MDLKYMIKKAKIKQTNFINHQVSNISEHTKDIINNSIFVAIEGKNKNGEDFIEEAILKGAKTIIHQGFICNKKDDINYIQVENTRKFLAILSNIFYHDITKKVKLIGITGTNGKSTIANLTHHFLEYMGKKSMLIGTDGILINQKFYPTENTTPSSNFILKLIYEAKKKKLEYVVMEVSSHAIKQCRVYGFDFDIVVFANLSHDHLDFHKTITDYRYTKGIFLSGLDKNKTVILNSDDDSFNLFYSFIKANILTYSMNNNSDFHVMSLSDSLSKGLCFDLFYKEKIYKIKSYLIGRFNIYNILASIAIIKKLNFKINDYINFLKIFHKVDGRMDLLIIRNRKILIDFAHTVEGVKNVCESLKNYQYKRLTIIIGSGGNRDKEKRPIIAKTVCEYANKVIFTSDNPRGENPIEIINDMTNNLDYKNYEVIVSRQKAIINALRNSIQDELIVILGKGNEKYQIINDIKYPYNDLDFIKKIFNKVSFNE